MNAHDHDEEELYRTHVFHRVDHDWVRGKYGSFYGHVADRQDAEIASHVRGSTVLDAGAGYGWATRNLRARGFDVTPIDLHESTREYARSAYGVEIGHGDVYALPYPDRSFDTVLLREVGEHVEFARAAPELARVARRAVVLFQTNVSAYIRGMRRLAGHHEFRSPPLEHYTRELERAGLRVDAVRFSDVLAFPLSGGHVMRQWLPRVDALYPAVLATDSTLTAALRLVRLDRVFAWRVLIRAVRA